eukprot:gene5371-5589_t
MEAQLISKGMLKAGHGGTADSKDMRRRDALRSGKKLLKAGNGGAAEARFEKALILSRAMGDQLHPAADACGGLAPAVVSVGSYQRPSLILSALLSIPLFGDLHEFNGMLPMLNGNTG